MIIAYLRVNASKQHLDNQKEEIAQFASGKGWTIDKWVTDVACGKAKGEDRNLGRILDRLKEGDILVVADISRLSRTLTEVMLILSRCMDKGVHLYCIKDKYILDDGLDCKAASYAFSLVAEIEHNLMTVRTKEALAHKRTTGVRLGRPKGSDAKQSYLEDNKEEMMNMLEREESIVAICKHFNVSRNTYYQFKRNYGL